MDCDLHHIIQSKQTLTEMHHKCFAKQMLEGIKAMHAVGVFRKFDCCHGWGCRLTCIVANVDRDLKPGNLLVSKDCRLRITDFGLARYMDETTLQGNNSENPMTEYVVTRWYRCPELLLAPNRPYNEAIDLWSIGCIIAELIKRKPLFPGKSHANQVQLIFEVMGFSNLTELGFQVSSEASTFLTKKCRYPRQNLQDVIPAASPEALLLINSLLSVNPRRRPSAAQSLTYAYLRDAETLCDYNIQYLQRPPEGYFSFESAKLGADALRQMILGEVSAGGKMGNFMADMPAAPADGGANNAAARRPSVPDTDAVKAAADAPPSQAPTQLKGQGPTFGYNATHATHPDNQPVASSTSSTLAQSGGRVINGNNASTTAANHDDYMKMKKSMPDSGVSASTVADGARSRMGGDEVDELIGAVNRSKLEDDNRARLNGSVSTSAITKPATSNNKFPNPVSSSSVPAISSTNNNNNNNAQGQGKVAGLHLPRFLGGWGKGGSQSSGDEESSKDAITERNIRAEANNTAVQQSHSDRRAPVKSSSTSGIQPPNSVGAINSATMRTNTNANSGAVKRY
jgi:serine/threonine protein kinase